jgi:hypothetical protein
MEEATVTAAIPEPKNYEVIAVLPGTLTIEKVKKATLGFQKGFTYSKVYGAKDPEYTKVTTASNLIGDEAFADNDRIAAIYNQLTITRPTVGVEEDVTEKDKGYEVSLGLIDRSQLKKDEYYFADNYETLELGTTILQVTPATLTISIASAGKTYDGQEASLAWEDDLSNMVVAGLPEGKDKDGIFTTKPTITIVSKDSKPVINSDKYNILLEGGESKNYEFTLLQGSYYTIDPVIVKAQFNNTYTTEVGAPVAEVLKSVDWTVVVDDEDQEAEGAQATVDAALAKTGKDAIFGLEYVGAKVTKDKVDYIAEGEDGDEALHIFNNDPVNFEFTEEFGDLIIGAAGSVLAIDDSKAVVTKAGKATVTFSQSRAVPQDVWQACVLPFDIDEIEDLSDAFGYAAVDLLDEDRTVGNEIHFSLKVTGGIPAGTPFLFKTNNNNNFNNAAFVDVTVANTADLDPVVEDKDTKVKFIGTFEGVNITTSGYRYLSKGTWYDTADGKAKPYVIKPLRAYLDLTEMVNASAARIFIEEPDGTVTAIDSITLEGNNAEGLYNLNGMKVNQGLKGVYIQNGKKVIKK